MVPALQIWLDLEAGRILRYAVYRDNLYRTVSAFHGKGKKSDWNGWALYGNFTDVLAVMIHYKGLFI